MRLTFYFVLALFAAHSLSGQTAVLRGQVTDESGAVILGAKVSLKGPSGAPKTTSADGTGSYTFAGLSPGNYSVQASAPQLVMAQPARVNLNPGPQVFNLILHIVSMAEKVTVQESGAPTVSTDSSNNASAVVLTGAALDALSDDPDDVLNAQNQEVLGPDGQPELAPITSIERYRRTLLFQSLNYTPLQIRALGGGATQFSQSAGIAELGVHQVDAGIFAGDEWRVRPNLTLNLGLRYETQSNINDWRDIAPRVAFAWAPRSIAQKGGKTVLRAGFGVFYDRFALSNTLAAQRYNGVVQQQYVVTDPDFYPNLATPGTLAGSQSAQVIQEISSRLRAPYILQSAVTLEHQLPANITLAVTYSNSHGMHEFRSEDINAPQPGTYNPSVQNSGVFPRGHSGPVDLMESSGIYNQNQLISNVNAKVNSGLTLFGFYVFNRTRSNTDGIGTFPANPYNLAGEYGPASTDVHHRVTVGGSINLKWAVRISPFVVLQSGAPFDINAGSDLYGTTMFNGRPGIATDPNKPGLIQTSYGLLDPNPTPGEQLLPRNFGRGPGQINVNLRVAKTIGFGRERGASGSDGRPAGGAGATVQAASGRGSGGLIGTPTTSHRFNLSIGLSIRNLLNHTNPGPIVGNITSPYFGSANQIAGGQNGEGFYETANNRRLESQIKFTF